MSMREETIAGGRRRARRPGSADGGIVPALREGIVRARAQRIPEAPRWRGPVSTPRMGLAPGRYYTKRWIFYSALGDPDVRTQSGRLRTTGLV
jgi:hypothetical protein